MINRCFITITAKNNKNWIVWNRVALNLLGDNTNLQNLQKELEVVKQHINGDMNQIGLALKDVDIKIEFK